MAYLVAKYIVDGELVPLLRSTLPLDAAIAKLAELATFPGQVTSATTAVSEQTDGELWFEIETAIDGDLVGDPVCFVAAQAQTTLVRTGLNPDQALRALVVVALDRRARAVLTAIQESCETPAETLNRVLHMLADRGHDAGDILACHHPTRCCTKR